MGKDIIINGIDVSECPLYDEQTGCYHTFDGECVKKSCTVYEWLLEYKRLQEENKKLKNKNNDLIEEIASGNIDITILQKENEKLKEFCIELEKQKEKQHKQWFERCTENHNEDSKIIEKYRSALKEIREIAEQWQKNDWSCYYCRSNMDGKLKEIIKLTEALNDRD